MYVQPASSDFIGSSKEQMDERCVIRASGKALPLTMMNVESTIMMHVRI